MTVLIIWDNKGTALYCRYSGSSEMFLIAVILYMHAKWEKKKLKKLDCHGIFELETSVILRFVTILLSCDM